MRTPRNDNEPTPGFLLTEWTRRFRSPEHGRGWIGIHLQTEPHEEPS
jgi:hypothetical protein